MRWIFHIGAGKTGTSSLQFTLRDSRPALAAAGVWYLGLMLEHAPVRHFEWQVFGGTELFHRLPQAEGREERGAVDPEGDAGGRKLYRTQTPHHHQKEGPGRQLTTDPQPHRHGQVQETAET